MIRSLHDDPCPLAPIARRRWLILASMQRAEIRRLRRAPHQLGRALGVRHASPGRGARGAEGHATAHARPQEGGGRERVPGKAAFSLTSNRVIPNSHRTLVCSLSRVLTCRGASWICFDGGSCSAVQMKDFRF